MPAMLEHPGIRPKHLGDALMNIIITGRTCNRCGEYKSKEYFYKAPRYINGLSSLCKDCEKLRRQKRFLDDPDHRRLLSRRSASKRRKENPEVSKRAIEKYRKSHPLTEEQKFSRREYNKKWREEHKDEIHQGNLQKYKDNPEYYKQKAKIFRDSHLDQVREKDRIRTKLRPYDKEKSNTYAENRRAKKLSVGGHVSKQEWVDLLNKFGYKCLCCGKTGIPLEQDHVIPLNPGKHSIDNIQPLCRSCNASKGRKEIDYRPMWSTI